ncbi:hypothetical protein PIB30_001772 [Stylosanthes scabra]|uniref:TIR domain-containing protein n=1 Tax=Stylosanthes scabra TaxID=79078 RepID=A0ABU6V3K8_9FABA|nr:hypothetical protein [Stylosanthes scabra]
MHALTHSLEIETLHVLLLNPPHCSCVFRKQGTPIHIQSLRRNDVYISSGLQKLDSFTSDLFHALILAGVNVLRNCRSYTNDLILSGPIKGCRVCIIVFTIDYASSIMCLQELVKVMEECHRSSTCKKVLPVFHCLDSSDVHNLSGSFGKVFLDTLQRNSTHESKVLTYRTALREAAAISPTFLLDARNESKVIEDIVAHVTSLLDSTDLFVAEHPVEVNSRVQDLIQLINNHKSDDVLIIAIWGMVGIGKTTIAKALYNQISRNFEEEVCPKHQGKAEGFDNSAVFLVLDDVRSEKELEVLPVSPEHIGPGSIIILTTWRKHDCLHEIGVNHIYKVKEMDYNKCVELFSWTAFKKSTPERSFSGLINYAVEYSDGLPLALVAVGSALSEKSIQEWENVLDSLKRFPLQDVCQILKEKIEPIGYEEKKMFAELAYLKHLLIVMDRNDISRILQEAGYCGAPIAISIKMLEEHSLVWFEEDKLCMHRLLQHIGRQMYFKESSIERQQRPYDVFLSFRGKDTRSKFISHLHTSLENAGIYVFKDDDGIPRGENLSISLLKALGESKIAIVILSPNYAFSRWCLQELEDIMICYENKTQKVIPRKVKRKEHSWRKALSEVGCIAGFVTQKSRNKSEDIKNIVEHVTRMLDMKQLFVANHPVGVESRVEELYSMKELNDNESIELFSWHAFKELGPKEEFALLANEVASYCEGLPLALEVIGSHLFNREVYEWRSVLEKLKTIPPNDVHKKLRISFDGLSDDREREIFLDVAFFFIGMDKNEVVDILNGCGHSAEIGINVLMERCLVTVDTQRKLGMHGLLRDMGREIIRRSLPTKPEKRSRLWNPEEVLNVLSKDMGTKAIEGLALNLPNSVNPTQLKTKAFKEMKRLRLLQFANVELVGDFKYLPADLRWLCWHGCPSEYTTANFDQANLVAIDFKYSKLELVWKKGQMMKQLKILNLSHSHHLTQTPDFSNLPNLKKLILKYCPKLTSVSHTIGHLKQVQLINFKGCSNLRVLPRSIYKLKSLETLILSGCSLIDKLEEDMEQMESLTTLMADKTAITQVPHALLRLKSIVYISLCGFEGLWRNVFPSIILSWTAPTNNFSPQLQSVIDLSNIVYLIIPNSHSQGLSSIIRELPQVQNVNLECGSQFQMTGDVASDTFNVTNCNEMIVTSSASLGGSCNEGIILESENSEFNFNPNGIELFYHGGA